MTVNTSPQTKRDEIMRLINGYEETNPRDIAVIKFDSPNEDSWQEGLDTRKKLEGLSCGLGEGFLLSILKPTGSEKKPNITYDCFGDFRKLRKHVQAERDSEEYMSELKAAFKLPNDYHSGCYQLHSRFGSTHLEEKEFPHYLVVRISCEDSDLDETVTKCSKAWQSIFDQETTAGTLYRRLYPIVQTPPNLVYTFGFNTAEELNRAKEVLASSNFDGVEMGEFQPVK